ncbi:MAG: hypothetical protein BWX87_01534 [Bacteroidetes bacterium ADurb.Bin123]|jgi:hypothetical protein|nr:MAG: hypothetical protein BWX87_01534 [Bacteroidetes bacterium ADurb.Bin123]
MYLVKFYKSLDKNVLSEIYDIRDTLTIQFRGEDEARQFNRHFSFNLNYDGKYVSFCKELSSKSKIFKNYYESIQVGGDISPSNYAMILHDYN